MAARVALYVASFSCRNVFAGASSATARCVGCSWSRTLSSVLVKPYTAVVISPVA